MVDDDEHEMQHIRSVTGGYGAVSPGDDKPSGAYLSFHNLSYTVELKRSLRERICKPEVRFAFNWHREGHEDPMRNTGAREVWERVQSAPRNSNAACRTYRRTNSCCSA